MDYEKLFPGRFIKSADFGEKDVTLAIQGVRAEVLDDGKAKAVMTFENARKELVLNRTNAEALKTMFGRETNDWIGKRVTFFAATIKDPFGDGEITAVRVRGSPDIDKPMKATVERGKGNRKKTIRVDVRPTGAKDAPPKQNGKPPDKPKVKIVDFPAVEMTDEEAESLLTQGEPGVNG